MFGLSTHSALGTLLRLPRFLRDTMSHPLNRDHRLATLWRYLSWQIGSRILGHPVFFPFVNHLRVLVSAGQWGVTGVVYCGLEEFEDMAFCMHFLRPGDLFIDVGANFGTFSLLASGVAGAKTIAFEPNPKTYAALIVNLKLNDLLYTQVTPLQLAVGERNRTVRLTDGLKTGDHILAGNGNSGASIYVEVNQTTLDEQLTQRRPTLLKIDVEGYESRVIQGATQTLQSPSLFGCIVEQIGLQQRYDEQEESLHQKLLGLGFRSYRYDPRKRELQDLNGQLNSMSLNTLYLRNLPEIQRRVTTAPHFSVRGHLI